MPPKSHELRPFPKKTFSYNQLVQKIFQELTLVEKPETKNAYIKSTLVGHLPPPPNDNWKAFKSTNMQRCGINYCSDIIRNLKLNEDSL